MTVDIRIGDCLEQLRTLPDRSVHVCVTSPPYFGLRDYGVAGQIGLEPTPDQYVGKMVDVFREVWRVLRDDGTLWLNLGDSYAGSGRGGTGKNNQSGVGETAREAANTRGPGEDRLYGLKTKDLIWSKPNPMPESVTDRPTKSHEYIFLLAKSEKYFYDHVAIMEPISQGTVDRMSQPNLANQHGSERAHAGDKTNGTMKAVIRQSGNLERKFRGDFGGVEGGSAHQGFAFPWASDGSHRPQYQRALAIAFEGNLTDAHIEAIRACGITDVGKAAITQTGAGRNTPEQMRLAAEAKEVLGGYYREFLTIQGQRNKRTVWTISTKPFTGAHFATFPPEIAETCILASTSARGCCPSCGAQWSRETSGWIPGCTCDAAEPVPATVLDPFFGAGTTGLVAQRINRRAIGIELNPEYAEIARARLDADGQHGYQQSLEIP